VPEALDPGPIAERLAQRLAAMPTSSVLWCASTCRSPWQLSCKAVPLWVANAVSMWSKKPMPVSTAGAAARSRSQLRLISVSLVRRSTWALRLMAPASAGHGLDSTTEGGRRPATAQRMGRRSAWTPQTP